MRPLMIISLFIWLSIGKAFAAKDVFLSGYYLGKDAIPFLILPAAIEDGDQVLWVDLGLFAVLTVPASGQ